MSSDLSSNEITQKLVNEVLDAIMEVFPFTVEDPPEARRIREMMRKPVESTAEEKASVKKMVFAPIAHDLVVVYTQQILMAAATPPQTMFGNQVFLPMLPKNPERGKRLGVSSAEADLLSRIVESVLLTTEILKNPVRLRMNRETYRVTHDSIYFWVLKIE